MDGKSAVHVCVSPLGFGSYENVEILRLLKQAGLDLNARDTSGKTALDYAMAQDSKVMAKELCTLLQTNADLSISLRRKSITPAIEWPEFAYDPSNDSLIFLEEAEKRRVMEVFEKKNELDYVPVDKDFKD